jgi:hypothetical protein
MRDGGIVSNGNRECKKKKIKINVNIYRSGQKTRESCPTL